MEDGDGGSPCPEDADFMDARPDAAEMEEAIGKFVNGLEQQERSGYHELHSLLSRLPVPVAKSGKTMSHAAAMEGGFLPKMTEEELKRFTPTELLLWRHAKEYRYRQCPYTVYTCISLVPTQYIHNIYMYIHVYDMYIHVCTCICLVCTCMYTLPLCGSCSQHGGQSSPDPLVPGW